MKAAIWVPAYACLVLGVWAILPPLGPEELVAFVIVAVLLLMTVVGFCMPTQEVDQ
ncbi:hypothetical protein [Gordonia westfalica]|uniref:Uncharacterized protein n=1 Tax=Gordonia westfalica TaxID=158898 RepID=A0A1H2DMP4_9ACTN|nr:hypothetical protein [Gordonia westfalica]SDT83720.1 hypothetical protein SAMN04488548_10140 [Gordonia westfalica]SDT83866.1 hypothetical protein SAMN04488548_1059 [Gordonia westfalica]SDT83931.1 hypothetical protein SAMN04488548_10530 [Gordonia westfalica]SDT83971.1 hypothetical protein SAMN04488548_10544 [Gordonia westfalica]SDT84056.1 hypothetical protein SAMN04488548_1063 [Gordonia westfalica]